MSAYQDDVDLHVTAATLKTRRRSETQPRAGWSPIECALVAAAALLAMLVAIT